MRVFLRLTKVPMALETATHINDLVIANPTGLDDVSQGDDHLRLLKDVLKRDLPMTAAASASGLTVLQGTPAAARTSLEINTAGPTFSAYASVNQSVTSDVATKVILNTEEFDTNANFDPVTNYRFTPTVSGYYQVNGLILGSGTGLTQIACRLHKNGSIYKSAYVKLGSVTDAQVSVATVIFMNGTTDYLELFGTITGATPVFFAGVTATSMSACWLRT